MARSDSKLARTFTLRHKEYELSRADVEKAAAHLEPQPTEKYAVQIGDRYFPPKQLLAESLGIAPSTFTTMDASRILSRLGFEIASPERQPASANSLKLLETPARSLPGWTADFGKEFSNLAVLDPHEDRALRFQNWIRDAWQEKRARNLFEAYLFATVLGNSTVQRQPQAGGSIPDFILNSGNKRIAIEVKELLPVDFEIASDVELYDPCRPIRERVSQAEQELSTMEDTVRCLVLYSRCTPWPIFDWRIITGVLRERGEAVQQEDEQRRPGVGVPNRRQWILDAVIVLDQLRTGYLRFKAHIAAQESKAKRMLTDTEYLSELQRARGTERDIMLSRPRVVVHENPNSPNRLPGGVFRGPSDEWYSLQDSGKIGRTFVGEEIQKLEKEGIYRPACA